jgi:hypothetical protein
MMMVVVVVGWKCIFSRTYLSFLVLCTLMTSPHQTGLLKDPGCKNTVAAFPSRGANALVHAGTHSTTARTNVSALFSEDGGKSWGNEVMVWQSPLVGGYSAVQAWEETVAVVFEHGARLMLCCDRSKGVA